MVAASRWWPVAVSRGGGVQAVGAVACLAARACRLPDCRASRRLPPVGERQVGAAPVAPVHHLAAALCSVSTTVIVWQMSREKRRRWVQEQREAGGETFTDVLRRVARRPPLLIKLVAVAAVTSAIGIAVFESSFELCGAWVKSLRRGSLTLGS